MSNGRKVRTTWPLHKLGQSPGARFATGLPVSGYWSTNATWLRTGTRTLVDPPPLSLGGLNLAYRPGYQRALFRWSLVAGAGYEVPAWLVHPWSAGVNTAAGVAAVASAYGYRAWLQHNQDVSEPARNALQLQLAKLLDTPYADAAVARDGTVTVELPKDFILSEGTAKALNDIVQRTMGTELDVSWPNLLKERTVTWSRIPEPPDVVRYPAIREKLLALPDGTLYLGVDQREEDLLHALDTDSPHIALSMPTGRGKSTTFRLLLAQLIEQGAGVTILDAKRISLNEFRNVPTVRLVKDIPAMWDEVELFYQEIGERYRLLDDEDPENFDAIMSQWRRKVLFIEELNAFRELSQQHWDTVRTSKDRVTPPVFATLNTILFMARQVRQHVVVASQRFEARTIGGGAAREQFGLRLLANPTKADWAMFGQGTKPRGAYSRKAGRSVAVFAGQARAVQLGYLGLADVREHIVTPRSQLADVVPSYLPTSRQDAYDTSYDNSSTITLREYAESNGDSLAALQRAVQRAGLTSVGVADGGAKLYEPAALEALRKPVTSEETPSYDASVVVADED